MELTEEYTDVIGDWEADLFPVFDRLKSALDRQEEARVTGKLNEFVERAFVLFANLEALTWRVWQYEKILTEYVYLSWKRKRRIDSWVPDRDLPLKWALADKVPIPVPPAEILDKIKAKHQGWKDQNKANAKAMKQEHRKRVRVEKAKTKKGAK